MQRVFLILALAGFGSLLSSCFLVSVPVKATGEIIEKSAHASGRAMTRGLQRATTPDGADEPDAYGEPVPPVRSNPYQRGNAGYYDAYGNPIR